MKGFRVLLNDEEYEFIKKLAKHDGMTASDAVNVLLRIKIDEEMKMEKQEHRFT